MKKAVTVITTVSVLLFFLALFYLALGIFIDRKSGPENATARYETLLLSARQTASRYKYGTSEFADNFVKAIGDINDFAKIDFELNDTLIYSYPPKSYSLPSSEFSKDFSEICILQNGSKIKLSASIYTMRPVSIYNHAKVSFIIILAGTITTILLLGYTSITESKKSLDDSLFYDDIPAETVDFQQRATSENSGKKAFFVSDDTEENEDDNDDEVAEEETEDEAETDDYDTHHDEEDKISEEPAAEEPQQNQPASQMELTSEELTAIKEIISTEKEYAEVEKDGDFVESNKIAEEDNASEDKTEEQKITLLDEASLNDNLSKELKAEGDVSLLIIRIENAETSSPLYQKVASLLDSQLKENSLIFKYKSDGFAVMLKDSSLNAATAIAEPLHSKILETVHDSGSDARVTVGISSKAMRSIEAERIIKEADKGEAHAREDVSSPIVAFRVNPEKYRQMLQKKQADAANQNNAQKAPAKA